jgi:hypothetical protein
MLSLFEPWGIDETALETRRRTKTTPQSRNAKAEHNTKGGAA